MSLCYLCCVSKDVWNALKAPKLRDVAGGTKTKSCFCFSQLRIRFSSFSRFSAWQGPGASPGSCSEGVGSRCRRPWEQMENMFGSLFGKFVERNDEQRLLRWHRGSCSVRRHRVRSGGFWRNATCGCGSIQSGCLRQAKTCMVKVEVWTCRKRLHLIWKPVPDLTQKNGALLARLLQCIFFKTFSVRAVFSISVWCMTLCHETRQSMLLYISRSEASSQISWRIPDA